MATPGWAQRAPAEVRIGCPDLDGEARGELEVRARAELAVRRASAPLLRFACAEGSLTVTLQDKNGDARSVRVTADPPATPVGAFLGSLHALLELPPKDPLPPFPAPAPVEAEATTRYVGPELEVLAQPLIVQVDGAEAFRVPRHVVAFSLDAAADLIR